MRKKEEVGEKVGEEEHDGQEAMTEKNDVN